MTALEEVEEAPPVCGCGAPATVALLTPNLDLVRECDQHARSAWRAMRSLGVVPSWWRL